MPEQSCVNVPRQKCINVPRQECTNVPQTECEDVPSQQCGEVCENIYWCKVKSTNTRDDYENSLDSLFFTFNVKYFRNVSNKRNEQRLKPPDQPGHQSLHFISPSISSYLPFSILSPLFLQSLSLYKLVSYKLNNFISIY